MSETKLKIFEPLKTYFAILCQNNCYDYSSCKELMDVLTRENCDPMEKFTQNFLNALSWFAVELRKADSPIGSYTIKNGLKEIFLKHKNDTIADIVNNISEEVDKSNILSGFKMNQDNGEGQTYKQILENIIKSMTGDASIKDINALFERWLNGSFPVYGENKKYFNDHIKDLLINKKIDACEQKLLNDFFEIIVSPGDKMSVNEYIDNVEAHEYGARLNAKVENGEAKILKLLPDAVKKSFNDFLVNPNYTGVNASFVYSTPDCYKLKVNTSEPKKEEYKVPDPKAVLDWFREEAQGVRRKTREVEVMDGADDEPYVDAEGSYNFPSSFENIVNYKDNWRADLLGRLWKKDDVSGKFIEYTDDDLKRDAESFQSTDGHCGKLCIFDDAKKCANFFERMMKRDTVEMSELSDLINSDKFVTSYKALKENIVKVNPLFVIGTLRMFGFEKYTELRDDGTKVVKIESFTRWWNRYGSKLTLTSSTRHKGLTPEPPANLELFFKLLITFINNNEFVLNPQTKDLISKSGKISAKEIRPFKQLRDKNGNLVDNPNYDKEMAIYEGRYAQKSQPESLSGLVDLMRKNASLNLKPVNMRMPENRLNLSSLLGLMVGITNTGHIRLGRTHAFSTGQGYIIGGNGGEDEMLPCSKNAFEIYTTGIKSLEKKNKRIGDDVSKQILQEIKELSRLEKEVYKKLYVLANYVKVINVMNDEAANDSITLEMMDNAINEYESKSKKLSVKSDSVIGSLFKNIYEEKTPSSYYSKLN